MPSNTTIMIDILKERAALNAAFAYLRARGEVENATEGREYGDPEWHSFVARKVNDLHSEPVRTETHTMNIESVVSLFFPPEEREKALERLNSGGAMEKKFRIAMVMIEEKEEENEVPQLHDRDEPDDREGP